MKQPIFEACVDTFDDAIEAWKNGAHRIEWCAQLNLGGTTPPLDQTKQLIKQLPIPVMVMIRPRGGDFVYSEEEIIQMKQEIAEAREAGAAGVVFGVLTPNNQIDMKQIQQLVDVSKGLEGTIHKAIDRVEDLVNAAIQLSQIHGIHRILTSGGQSTALEGALVIRNMQNAVQGVISIIAAGKVTSQNWKEVQQKTGVNEFHGKKIVAF